MDEDNFSIINEFCTIDPSRMNPLRDIGHKFNIWSNLTIEEKFINYLQNSTPSKLYLAVFILESALHELEIKRSATKLAKAGRIKETRVKMNIELDDISNNESQDTYISNRTKRLISRKELKLCQICQEADNNLLINCVGCKYSVHSFCVGLKVNHY